MAEITPVRVKVGRTWSVTVTLTSCGQPLRIGTGWTLWGDFYATADGTPQRIQLTSLNTVLARGNLVVPMSVTSAVPPQPSGATTFPCHVALGCTSGGQDFDLGAVYFLPLDPGAAGISS